MFLISLLALSLAAPAAPAAQPAVPPHRWTVDYSRTSCTLARRVGEDGSAIVAFNARLGEEPGELLVMDGGSGLDSRLNANLDIRLDDGPPLILRARREQRNGRWIVTLRPMPDDFLGRVAAARQLTVRSGAGEVLSLAMPEVRSAVDALSRCNDDLLQSWGIDVAARRALQREPRATDLNWASEIYANRDTFLVFAVDVSEAGEPSNCRVVVSSRNPRMDRAVCELVQRSAHFHPALDSAGRPVRAQYVNMIRYIGNPD
jgi:hypothetical protein